MSNGFLPISKQDMIDEGIEQLDPERSEFLLNCIQIPSISNNLNVNPLEINSPESHNLLENSILARL